MKRMKFEEEHRGITRQVVLVILFALACLVFLLHYKSIFGVVGSFFSALFPLFVGFFIALALYPMQNSIEHYLTSAFAGMAKRHAARAAKKQKIDIAAGASDRSSRPASEKANRGFAALASSVRRRLGRKKESGHKASSGSSVNKSARLLSIIIAMLAVILVIVLFISVMIPQITDSYENLRVKYLDLSESITGLMESLNTGDENYLPNQLLGMIKSFISGITESLTDLTPYVLDVLKSSVSVTMDIFLGIVIAIYLLIDRERLLRVCRRLLRAVLPRKVVDRIKDNSSFIFEVYNSYITGKMIDIVIIWGLSVALLSLFRIPFAPFISIILAIMNVIPYIGIFIGLLPGSGKLLFYLIVVVAIHLIDSKLIEKYVLKTTCSIDPELLIIAVVFFGGLFGTPFMFIAAPIATIINYFAKESVNRLILDRKRDVKTEDTVGSEADDTTEND